MKYHHLSLRAPFPSELPLRTPEEVDQIFELLKRNRDEAYWALINLINLATEVQPLPLPEN
jgi:hypothetical protein